MVRTDVLRDAPSTAASRNGSDVLACALYPTARKRKFAEISPRCSGARPAPTLRAENMRLETFGSRAGSSLQRPRRPSPGGLVPAPRRWTRSSPVRSGGDLRVSAALSRTAPRGSCAVCPSPTRRPAAARLRSEAPCRRLPWACRPRTWSFVFAAAPPRPPRPRRPRGPRRRRRAVVSCPSSSAPGACVRARRTFGLPRPSLREHGCPSGAKSTRVTRWGCSCDPYATSAPRARRRDNSFASAVRPLGLRTTLCNRSAQRCATNRSATRRPVRASRTRQQATLRTRRRSRSAGGRSRGRRSRCRSGDSERAS